MLVESNLYPLLVKIWYYLLHTFSLHISPRYAFSGTPGKVTNRFVNSTARACLVDEFTLTLSFTSFYVCFHYSRFLIYFFSLVSLFHFRSSLRGSIVTKVSFIADLNKFMTRGPNVLYFI